MFFVLILFFIGILISMLMIFFSLLINKKSWQDREKLTPFECGFDPITSARIPFSMQFFLIMLIFLIFDIEISLFIPMIISIKFISMKWLLTSIILIMILLIGIYLEWMENSIKWIK